MGGVWFFRSEGALGQAESQRWKKQVGCEKGIHTAEETIESNNGRGSTKWGKEREGVFPASSEKQGFFFFFFDLYFFFFVSFLLLFMEPGRWACLFVRLFRACRDPWIFFFLAPTWSAHSAQRKAAQMAANRLHLEERKSKFATFQKKKKKKTSLLNLSISVVCLYQYPFFFFCLLFGLHSSAFCASSILSCFIKGVLARTRKPRLLSAPAHRLSHCRYQDVIQDCRAKKKTNQKKNKKKKELQSYFCEA